MKDIKEICRRCIILLAFSDRCAIEKEVSDGIKHTLEERKQQRKFIYEWLERHGYIDYLTAEEKRIFEMEVGTNFSQEILSKQVIHEALEPLLWSLGLVKRMTPHYQFVITDFHPLLLIGPEHSLEKLVGRCNLRSYSDIILQREISMLWNWRLREANSPIMGNEDFKNIILSTFGQEYKNAIKKINFCKDGVKDFKVGSIPFYSLSDIEKQRIALISLWRHHALEWVTGVEDWDDVDTST